MQDLVDMFIASSLSFPSELYTLMKEQDDGVKELKLERENRIFNHCFPGTVVFGCIDVTGVKNISLSSSHSLTPSLFLHRYNSNRVADFKGQSEK